MEAGALLDILSQLNQILHVRVLFPYQQPYYLALFIPWLSQVVSLL